MSFDLARELRHAGNNLRHVIGANLDLARGGADAAMARRLERIAQAEREWGALWDALLAWQEPHAAPLDPAAFFARAAPLLALAAKPATLALVVPEGLPSLAVERGALLGAMCDALHADEARAPGATLALTIGAAAGGYVFAVAAA
jgi:hypothetical protein